ncbi:hypothetical protein N7603_05465 [Acholeplasma vituli]|uniref:Helicase ATP-binding domain-containing protein n=1 Tax=Paracholeplasma vituli TaxID=69473 RepID=A0ABT2PVW3_9MOLU|nr:hypothetical protein [Paracholeplasma vituli]MCU0105101.1 hypothetical protein [Paracholeplasma vituli]
MKDLILEKIDIMDDSGLFLLEAPTGLGKTRAVIECIKELLASNLDNRIFYITNLKKNIPEEKLLEALELEYKTKVLFLLPNVDFIIKNLKSVPIDNLEITNHKTYKDLSMDYENYQNCEKSNEKQKKNSCYERLTQSEKKFRNYIKEKLFYGKDYTSRKATLLNNPWLSNLYPFIDLANYKIILMSTDKFINLIDPLISSSYFIYQDKMFSNSIVFFDEFDSSKERILNKIINDGTKNDTNILKTFMHIHNALNNTNIPETIFKNNSLQEIDCGNSDTYRRIIEENRKRFAALYEKYKLKYLLKNDKSMAGSTFLFDDRKSIQLIRKNMKKNVIVKADEKESINLIVNSSDTKPLLRFLVSEISKQIDYFINCIIWLERNYRGRQNGNNYFTKEESFSTILSVFNLDSDSIKYIKYRVQFIGDLGEINLKEATFENEGLHYIEIEDSTYHNEQSSIRMFSFPSTPEKFIVELCNTSKMIGLSATVTINTTVGNYNYKYIKKCLQDRFYEMTPDDSIKIQTLLNEKEKLGNKILPNVKIQLLDQAKAFSDQDTLFLYSNELLQKYDYTQLSKDYNIDSYRLAGLLKLLKAYSLFELSSSKSMISFLNANMSQELRTIFKNLTNKLNCEYKSGMVNICYLTGDNFGDELLYIHNKLNNFEKVFVITTYATVSYGKNIQYSLTQDMQQTILNYNENHELEKDFESIYLQTPTNLLTNLTFDSYDKHKDISKFLFEQEYQYNSGVIAYSKMKENINRGFRKLFMPDSDIIPISIQGDELYFLTAQKVIQALGRINRSRYINKDSYIYIDEEILYRLQKIKRNLTSKLSNYNMTCLLNYEHSFDSEHLLLLNEYNNRAKNKIDLLAHSLRGSFENISEWKKIRLFVLKYPTLEKKLPENDWINNLYYQFLDEVSYYSYDGFIKINHLILGKNFGQYEVSIHDSGLLIACRNKEIKDYLEMNNVETKFKRNCVHMLPATYKQIYKGALGEIVGKFIVEHVLGIELEEITSIDHYEFFDYKYYDIYFDFKNWHYISKNENNFVPRMMNKLKKLKGKRVIVINVFEKYGEILKKSRDGYIYQVSSLLNENGEITDRSYQALYQVLEA